MDVLAYVLAQPETRAVAFIIGWVCAVIVGACLSAVKG